MAESTKSSKKGSNRSSSGKAKKTARKKPAPKAASKAQKSTASKARKAKPSKSVAEKAKEPVAKAAEVAKELPSGAAANAALAGKAALDGTRAAGKALGLAATKARIPLVTGAGLAAGAAGGLAIVRRRNGHRRPHSDLEPLISAARRAGSFGEELGRMATLMEKAAKGK